MDGAILQCDNGHFFCEECYHSHVAACNFRGSAARCPTCRIKLLPAAIRCLYAEQTIAAKKEQQAAVLAEQQAAVVAEVQEAEREAVMSEVAVAVAEADKLVEQQEAAAVLRLVTELGAEEEAQARTSAQAAEADAMAIAQTHGDGDVDAQAQQLAKYSRKRSRERAASLDTAKMKDLVREVVANEGIDQSAKDVRVAIETRLQLNAEALKDRKSDISACIDEILSECASCQADLSDRKDDDDLDDPDDGRLYCPSCWKARALGG